MAMETITLADFMAGDYEAYEYVKGELVPMPSPTIEHGELTLNIGALLRQHIREYQLGSYSTETTFPIGKSGRRPDVAFLSKDYNKRLNLIRMGEANGTPNRIFRRDHVAYPVF